VLGIGVLAANASEWRKKVSGATEPPGNFSAARRHSARDLKVKIQKTQKNAKERLNFQYGELLAKLIERVIFLSPIGALWSKVRWARA
jgi:hypothetical protein